MVPENIDSIFDERMKKVFPLIEDYANYDLLVGIPFSDEGEALVEALTSIDHILQQWIGRRQLIICCGDARGGKTLDAIKDLELEHPCIAFCMPQEVSGRGMSIRALLELAGVLESDLLIFRPDMMAGKEAGFGFTELEGLLTPIQGPYDMVVGSLRKNQAVDSMVHQLLSPILESFYGYRLSDPLGGVYALSHDFIEELVTEAKFWSRVIYGAGIDIWMITRALVWDKSICEINMGGGVSTLSLEQRNRKFKEIMAAVLESLKKDQAIWTRERLIVKVADIITPTQIRQADENSELIELLCNSFQQTMTQYKDEISQYLPEQVLAALQNYDDGQDFHMEDQVWVNSLFHLILYYTFKMKGDTTAFFDILTALYNGRFASYLTEMRRFREQAVDLHHAQDEILVQKMEQMQQRLLCEFWRQKPAFIKLWAEHSERAKPPLIPLGYMEYVPNKPIVVPKIIKGKDQRLIQSDNVFKALRQKYEERFNTFMQTGLQLSADASPEQMFTAVADFMDQVEHTLDQLLPGDLHSSAGMELFTRALFDLVPHQKMFTLNTEILREMLVRFPPINLMIPLGFYKPIDLINEMDARDAVTLANLVESWSYTDRDLVWLVDELKPQHFEWVEIKPLLISDDLPFGTISHTRTSNLNKLTARLTVKPLEKGRGGRYPKLKYFHSLVRRLCVAEQYSRLFYQNICERKNIGLKLKNALLDSRKGEEFSAHNIFENNHHRAMVGKIEQIADHLQSQGKKEEARLFNTIAQGYGLSQVLENGKFLTCTTWSWASYSYKGGTDYPTPFTTSVEYRWFNHDFLEALYRELGYHQSEIMQIVYRHMQAGKSEQNVLDTLLPARPKDVTVIVQESTNEPSKYLTRYQGNPLLTPLEEHKWESKYVLNPGALRIGDKVYLFYRAVGNDNISRIGLAISDGYKILERLPQPIFSPANPEEKMGCEDARLIIINERIWMLYTAYDGNIAQIAAASISVDEFLQRNWAAWKREGLAFKNIWDKDAILFPERINGKYILYHRIEPSIWITYMEELSFPCREKHAIIIGPRPGRMWDSLKIGAGAQPLKTKYGWLLIYHGVDHHYVYRLGVLLVDLHNPQKVLYRSPNPILEPLEDYEVGLSGAWVPNVVFTCGAVPGVDKEILEDDDEILVYYGAADTSIGLASATLAELIPKTFRSS